MSTDIAVVGHQQFVALTPAELPAAQRDVIGWCRAKIHALSLELREQRENAREAKRMLWRNRWPSAIRKTERLMIYYAKVKKALEAGYLIVPNFNVDVVAVRVTRDRPPLETSYSGDIYATPALAPPGAGYYVANKVLVRDDSYTETVDGKVKRTERYGAKAYDTDLEFPSALVKPAVLDATDRAMALRLFDRVGVVRASRRSDPIVVGQIVSPKERYWQNNARCVSFFVAWWLDTKDL